MKKENINKILAGITMLSLLISCTPKSAEKETIEGVPFTSVKATDNFWAPKIKINHEVTIPIAIEQSTITGRIKNFEIAGGLTEGDFCSEYPFDDSDIYKIIEAASYSMQTYPDAALDARIDSLIYKIGKAQEEDGYIYTIRTIMGDNSHSWIGDSRWSKVNELSHELYNLGHMFEGAVAHFQSTGKRNFLDIAIKAADMLVDAFGWGKIENFPGHQEVELGLIKLYHVTNDQRYLDLAKFFLDVRGTVPGGDEYNQSHEKVVEQTKAVGHAVRATYMYSAMADIAALYNDESYSKALHAIWEDIVYTKIYVTGGIGASGGNEGFSEDYNLPNMSAYCETCASIGMMIWNYRMFLAEGNSKYFDIFERTLYNAFLSGVNLKGDRFFYPNVLESMGQHDRGKWFGCACCPPNLARMLPSLPGYVYATSGNNLYVNLYMNSEATIQITGTNVAVIQTTQYPWKGQISISINPEVNKKFGIKVRIPGWAMNSAIPGDLYTFINEPENEVNVKVNGKKQKLKLDNGYLTITRTWKPGDKIDMDLPMNPRYISADERVKANNNKVSVERGPIMYCAEWPDNKNGNVLSLLFDKEPQTTVEYKDDLLNGVPVIKTSASEVSRNIDDTYKIADSVEVTLIPYFSWNNRGPGEMMVWLPTDTSSVYPQPAPTIANRSSVSASRMLPSLKIALTDQYEPDNSNDHNRPYYHWWPENNSWQWVQYEFEDTETISSSRVYWFDDGPFGGCRIPVDWKLEYLDNGKWKPVKPEGEYTITKDGWDEVQFKPVTTKSIKMKVKLSEEFSSGIHEWEVK
ncbi:MAG: glycoside hydrolase family 127 protein [Bacteroidales bacterium]|nr:glycoside hydrolase family 127 protein [Bacteroidales bacterium]